MSVCIAFAGCQAEHHRPDCAKFDQRTEDYALVREACADLSGNWEYGPVDALVALDRLIKNDY